MHAYSYNIYAGHLSNLVWSFEDVHVYFGQEIGRLDIRTGYNSKNFLSARRIRVPI